MDNKITSLQPQAVWKYFNAICQVPRPSGHLDKITEYIMGVGRSLGLETILDKAGNVIIRKPATPGRKTASRLFFKDTWIWFLRRINR